MRGYEMGWRGVGVGSGARCMEARVYAPPPTPPRKPYCSLCLARPYSRYCIAHGHYRRARSGRVGCADSGGPLLAWRVTEQPGCLARPGPALPYSTAAQRGNRDTLAALRRLVVPWGPWDTVATAVRIRPR